jgi:hypothetical protein
MCTLPSVCLAIARVRQARFWAVTDEPKRPQKRTAQGSGRVTPKGGGAKGTKGASGRSGPAPSSRYTPPIPAYKKVSPPWWPATMFVPWGLGIVVIILNYVMLLPGSVSNWWVMVGLLLILVGIIAATQYH